VVFKLDGTEVPRVVILTETFNTGVKVRIKSGDFILNVDEKLVALDDSSIHHRAAGGS